MANEKNKAPEAQVAINPNGVSLASRIVSPGKVESTSIAKMKFAPQPAGLYEVTFGRVRLGHEHPRDKDGQPHTHLAPEPVDVHKGGQLHLSAEEAASLVASGNVKLVKAASASAA